MRKKNHLNVKTEIYAYPKIHSINLCLCSFSTSRYILPPVTYTGPLGLVFFSSGSFFSWWRLSDYFSTSCLIASHRFVSTAKFSLQKRDSKKRENLKNQWKGKKKIYWIELIGSDRPNGSPYQKYTIDGLFPSPFPDCAFSLHFLE